MTDKITIVTAFFDLGRGDLPAMIRGRILPHHQHRSVETYFEFFDNLARINNPMVIHTTKDLSERIAAIRDRKSTRLNSSHVKRSRMPSSA